MFNTESMNTQFESVVLSRTVPEGSSLLPKNSSRETNYYNEFILGIDVNTIEGTKKMMTLPPRLQEYIKKKSFYQKNNINVEYPLEKTYNVTQKDMALIKKLFSKSQNSSSGGTNQSPFGLSSTNDNSNESLIEDNPKGLCASRTGNNFQAIGVNNFQPNYSSLNHPLRTPKCKQTEPYACRRNPVRSIDYKLANRQNNYCLTPAKSLIKQNINNIDSASSELSLSDAHYLNYPQQAIQNNNSWKKVLDQKPMKFIEDNNYSRFAIGDVGNNVGSHTNRDYIDNDMRPMSCSRKVSSESQFDLCTKNVFPNQRLDKCYSDVTLNTAFYKAIPFMGNGSGIGDMDTGTALRSGISTRGSRQKKESDAMLDRFEFLDRDMQDPQHIIMDGYRGGYDSRQTDKLVRRNYYKVI